MLSPSRISRLKPMIWHSRLAHRWLQGKKQARRVWFAPAGALSKTRHLRFKGKCALAISGPSASGRLPIRRVVAKQIWNCLRETMAVVNRGGGGGLRVGGEVPIAGYRVLCGPLERNAGLVLSCLIHAASWANAPRWGEGRSLRSGMPVSHRGYIAGDRDARRTAGLRKGGNASAAVST
jgi:hypothetical protein